MKFQFNYYIEYLAFAGFKNFLEVLPEKLRFSFSAKIGSLAYKALKSRRITTLLNLKLAFPEKSNEELEEIAIESYKTMAKAFLGTLWLDKYVEKKENFKIEEKILNELVEREKKGPLVIGTMHFGNMEGLVKITEYFNLVTVGKDQRNPYINKMIIENRTRFNLTLLQKNKNTGREIIRYAKENRNIGVLTDHRDKGANIILFGEETISPTGVTSIALKYNRPLLLMYCVLREDNTTEIFSKEIEISRDEEINFKERVQMATQKLMTEIEEVIKLYPSQWMWMHDRWNLYSKLKKGQLEGDLLEFSKTIK